MKGSFPAGKPREAESGFNARAIVFKRTHEGNYRDAVSKRIGGTEASRPARSSREAL